MRVCWFDPEPDGPPPPIEWRTAAAILASLFLNLAFLNGVADRFPLFCPAPIYVLLLAGVTVLTTTLWFLGPAAALLRSRQSLSRTMADSLGSLPAIAIRLIAIAYLIYWIGKSISRPIWWLATDASLTGEQHPYLVPIALAIVVFLLFTGLQNARTVGKLAWFTNKLGIAILLAALIRVHDGWTTVFTFWRAYDDLSWLREGRWAFAELVSFTAPLGLLAAELAPRLRDKQQVGRAYIVGVAVPVFAVLLLVGVIVTATYGSAFYQPSLSASVLMALWSKAASSALLPGTMIVTVAAFGAARFGVMMLPVLAFPEDAQRRWRFAALFCATLGIVWSILHPYWENVGLVFMALGRSLSVTSAILTADFLMRRPSGNPPRLDPTGCAAFLISVSLPWHIPHTFRGFTPVGWWRPWLLPSYIVAFAACILGRVAEQAIARRRAHLL